MRVKRLSKKLWNNRHDTVCSSITLPDDSYIVMRVLGYSVVLTHYPSTQHTEFYANCVKNPIDTISEFIRYFV